LLFFYELNLVLILVSKFTGGLGELENLNFTQLENDAEVGGIFVDEKRLHC
jgi:hypothetical protein